MLQPVLDFSQLRELGMLLDWLGEDATVAYGLGLFDITIVKGVWSMRLRPA